MLNLKGFIPTHWLQSFQKKENLLWFNFIGKFIAAINSISKLFTNDSKPK